jgi:hypothetical protein
MLTALIAGPYDPKQLAQMACGRLREKTKKLELAIDGHFTDHYRLQRPRRHPRGRISKELAANDSDR